MVAIVAGNGLGLFNATLNSLGGAASGGQGSLGQAGGQAFVNTSTGNLILQFTDEQLSGLGRDLQQLRTYNTQGALSDADGDGWRWGGERQVALTGTRNATGSTIRRTTGDGHEAVYVWTGSLYQSTAGDGAHDTLQWVSGDNQWLWTDGSRRTQERYDGSTGRLVSTVDANGTNITYSYDAGGKLSSIKDSSGQELVLVYNANGQLARLDTRTTNGGALSRQVYYTYDTSGRLSTVKTDLTPADNSISDGKVYTTTYTYSGSSFRIASVTQSDGSTASFTYELVSGEYRVKTVTDASGTTTFTYDIANRRTDVSNGLGQLWSYYYDTSGQLTQTKSPAVDGQRLSTTYTYDSSGNVTQITDGLGNTVTYGYDSRGNRVLERDADGNTITRVFNGSNQMLNEARYSERATWDASSSSWIDPPSSSRLVTRHIYDAQNRLRYQISASGNVVEYRYDANGLLAKEIVYGDATYSVGSLGATTTRNEAQLDSWAAERNLSKGQLTEYTYDYRGNLTQSTRYATITSTGEGTLNSAAVVTNYVYSEHGQLLQTIAVRGTNRTSTTVLSSVVYDGMGRVLSQVDSNGTRTHVYNGGARSITQTNAAGQSLTQTYDTAGRLISLSQSATGETSRTTQYVYDAAGRLTMTQDPTGARSYVFYDQAGRVSARVDGTGAVTEYSYDGAGQLVQQKAYATLANTSTWYNGTTVTKTLVSQVRPTANAADRVQSFVYDDAGQLTQSTDAAGVSTFFTYDGRGKLLTQQTGDRVTRFFYTATGQQHGVLDAEGYLTENFYDAAGQLIRVLRWGGLTTESLRTTGTLLALRPTSGTNLQSWFYYDSAGRQIGSVDEQQFVTETVYNEAGNTLQTIRYAKAFTASIGYSATFNTIRTGVAANGSQTTTLSYDAQGRVSQRTAPDGTITTYSYDAAGRLVSETQAAGTSEARTTLTRYNAYDEVIGKLLGEASTRITAGMTTAQVQAVYAQYGLTYSYDAAGRVASVTDAAGNRTSSYYDAAGRLTHVINALGEVSETLYSAFGDVSERTNLTNRLSTANTASLAGGVLTTSVKNLVQAIRNANTDNRASYVYDKRGLLTSSTNALGYLTAYGHNDFGDVTSVTRTIASGQTVTQAMTYDKLSQQTSVTDDVGGLNRTTQTVYDAFGRVIQQIDGRGQSYTTSYDSSGRIITVNNPLNKTQKTEYDAFGRVLKETDALGRVTQYSYNTANRSMTVTSPEGVTVTTVSNRHGQTLTITDGEGSVTTYSYNKDGQRLTTKDGLNRTTTNTYDDDGRLFSVTDALGRVTTYGYDAANRLVSMTDAAGTITTYTFDGQGRQVRVTQAQGLAEQRITDYAYDKAGQVLKVTQDPNGLKLTTTYTYDGLGQQVQVAQGTTTSPSLRVTQYVYDKLGRRTTERQDPAGLNLTTQYRYNENDQVTRKIDANGNSTWYRYDSVGRVLESINALGVVTRNVYDANGRVTLTKIYGTPLSSSAINALGNAPTSVNPSVNAAKDQVTFFIRDADGQLRYTINGLHQVTETVYDDAGRVLETRQYDKAIAASTARTVAATAAALTSAGAQARTTSYAYDAAGQLTSTTDAAGKTESYTYDAVGNRKTLTNKNGAVWRYNYDSLNRLSEELTPAISVASISTAGTVTSANRYLVTRMEYDALGNVISRSEGRLRSSVNNAASSDSLSQARTSTYSYDAVGRQVQITSPGWYNKATGQYQQSADTATPSNTFQVTTEVTYDAVGNAVRNRVRVNNTGNAATDFVDSFKVYDVLGRVTHDVDAMKGVVAYTYDAMGNTLTTKRHANALTKALPSRGYYISGDITSSTLVANSAQDRTLTISYDKLGRKVAVQQNSVGLYQFTGSVAASTLVNLSPTTLYTYDAFGQVVRETQVGRNSSGATAQTGASTTYYYDVGGNQIGSVSALGHYTASEYDALGQLTRQVEYANPLASWNETSLPTAPTATSTDRSTRYSYDAMGRLHQVTLENVTYWQQTNTSGLISASKVTGDLTVSTNTYDNVGNIATVTDAAGNVTTTQYNAVGHVTKLIEPARATAKAGVVDPFAATEVTASPTTTYLVNAFGQVVQQTRAAGTGQQGLTQVTRTRYDASGYEVREIQANNAVVDFKVDVAGRRIEERQTVSATLSAWTVNGQAKTYSQTLRRTYSYDALGQQLSTTDWYNNGSKSTVNSAVYNRFGEVSEKRLNGHLLASYSYDQAGRLSEQTDSQGVTRFDYDLSGAISRQTQVGDVSTTADDRITYMKNDLLGRILQQHLPAFEANINADTLNNVNLTLTTPIINQSFDRWGNLLSQTNARGYTTTYTYDHNNQGLSETLPETDILRENGTSYRASLIHERRYDAAGRLIQEVDLVGPYTGQATSTELRTRQHVYNAAGQLTRDIDALGYSRYYSVDAHGNRVAVKNALGTVLTDGYDVMNQHISHKIIRDGSAVTLLTKQYDQAGRLYAEISGETAIEETLTSTANANWSSTTTGVAGNVRYSLFDERGNIVTTRNESKIERNYVFDTENRKSREIDALGNSLDWTYDNADFGRKASYSDLDGRTYTYEYNDFGQINKELSGDTFSAATQGTTYVEQNTTENKIYRYYGNGLLRSTTTGYSKESEAGVLLEENSKTTTYEYDTQQSRTREINSAKLYLLSGTRSETLGDGSTVSVINSGLNQTSSSEVRYLFDEQSRLAGTKAPSGNTLLNAQGKTVNKTPYFSTGTMSGTLSNTAKVDVFSYSYDELGNRRRIQFNTKDQSNTVTNVDDWYTYDLEGRVLIGEGTLTPGGQIAYGTVATDHLHGKGKSITYDAIGRRQTLSQWYGREAIYSGNFNYLFKEHFSSERYTYTDDNKVQASYAQEKIYAYRGPSIIDVYIGITYTLTEVMPEKITSFNSYTALGVKSQQETYNSAGHKNSKVDYTYRGDGELIDQKSYNYSGSTQILNQVTYFNESGMRDAAGNQTAYRYVVYASNGTSISYRGNYTKTYEAFDGYKESIIDATWTKAGTPGKTTMTYTSRGELLSAVATGGTAFNRTYASNREGQLIARRESNGRVQSYLYYDGANLANFGNVSTPEITDTFTPISADYPANTPSNYVVNEGDTLEGIARTVWGDAKMWYLIADANGLDPAVPLVAGSNVKIPNVVSSNHNDAKTFKPYKAEDVIGNTTPSPKPPPPKGGKKCGGIASVVMVVVAVVAAVYTAGAALGAIQAASAGTSLAAGAFGGGLTATMTAGVTAMAGGSWAAVGAAAIGGAIGSAASQLTGMAMGAVDGFSWRQVAAGALSGGVGAGVSGVVGGGKLATQLIRSGDYGRVAASAVLNAVGSHGANKIAGLDSSFSWASMAASAVAAVGSAATSKALQLTTNNFAHNLANGFIGGQMGGSARRLMGVGGKVDYASIATDAFGNAIGNGLVEASLGGSFLGPQPGDPSRREGIVAGSLLERLTGKPKEERLREFLNSGAGTLPFAPEAAQDPDTEGLSAEWSMGTLTITAEVDRTLPVDGGATWIGNVVRSSQGGSSALYARSVHKDYSGSDIPLPLNPGNNAPKVGKPFSLGSTLSDTWNGLKTDTRDYVSSHSPFSLYAYNDDPIYNGLVFVNNAYRGVGNVASVGLSLVGDAYYETGANYLLDPYAGSVLGSGAGMVRQATQASAARTMAASGRMDRALAPTPNNLTQSPFKLGTAFEDAGVARAASEAFEQGQMTRRLSVRAFDDRGNLLPGRTQLDAAGLRADTGEFGALEFKLSENAPFTKRQLEHFPYLQKNGGVIVGNNGQAIGLPAGSVLEPFGIGRVTGHELPTSGDWWMHLYE